ncbi:MAG: amidohydrolase family protein [Chloroflexi bacterium]|nr:amidohydrolase family protein [Chloroflexota bacterium]
MIYTSRIRHRVSRFTHYAPRTTPLYFKNIILLTAAGPSGDSVRIEGERVAAINDPPRKDDRIIDGQGGLMIPGLINAHDHLELHTFKRLKYRERYIHSRQWIEDIEARFESDPDLTAPRRQPLTDRLLIGVLKNLLCGVTTVCHHNPLHKSVRRDFLLHVIKDYGFCHSPFRGDDVVTSYRRTKAGDPWIIHLAEGIDAEAAGEFDQLDRLGALQQNTILVHGVGLTRSQRQALIDRGGGLIWCPGSNHFLFGQTACVQEVAEAGKLALGSDSRLSGEFDLLAELQVANQTGQLSPHALFRSVTVDAARILRLREGGQGQIVVGGVADLVLLPLPIPADPFTRLLDLTRAQLELVLLAGKPLLGSLQMQPVFEATKTQANPVWLDGVEKLMSQRLVIQLKKSAVSEPGLRITNDG